MQYFTSGPFRFALLALGVIVLGFVSPSAGEFGLVNQSRHQQLAQEPEYSGASSFA